MPPVVKLERNGELVTLRLSREHGNAINDAMVDELMAAIRLTEVDDGVRGVLLAASGKLFCPGLDLLELVELDRPAMERFMQRFAACLLVLYTFPKPMVAAIHGHALAGGCVLTLTADRRILAEGAKIGLNEVRVGLPLPFGVATILRESVHLPRLEEVALLGRNYEGQQAVATGLAHELRAREGFEDGCLERLAEFASKETLPFSTTKRYLRSATVERFRGLDRQFAGEWLDGWFSEPSQRRVRELVEGLRGGGRG